MGTRLRTLIVEDSHSDALLLLRELKRADYDVEHTRVDNSEDMIEALESSTWDVILSDFSMPNFSATAALKLVQERKIDIPFIIVSGTMGEESAVAAMKAGAHDYFPKGRIARLAAAINRELRDAQERQQRREAEEALRRAEERFSKAFQVSPIGITINSSEGFFLSVNDSFRRMLNITLSEIVGRTALELGIWNDPDQQRLLENTSGKYKSVRDAELSLRTQTGEIRNVAVSTESIDLGGEACVLAMWQDITERKQAEDALRKNIELTQLLQDVTVAANEATEINSALQFAVDHICRFADWSLGHAFIRTRGALSPNTTSVIFYLNDTEQHSRFGDTAYRAQLTEAAGGLVYQVFTTGEPQQVIRLSYASDPLAREIQDAGIKSVYTFPIFAHHDVAAVMEFFSTKADEPDQALLDTIPHIATQVGHVIERVKANEEIKALYDATAYLFNADTVQDLTQQIVQGVVKAFAHVDCGLLVVDEQTGQLNRLARAGQYQINIHTPLTLDGPGLIPKAIREGRITYAPDVEQDSDYLPNVPSTRSEMVVPLRTREGIIGALDLQSSQRDYFNESDQRVLTAFAERAAAALQIIQLYEEINRYATQLELRVVERTQELQKAKEHVEIILHNSSDAIILVDEHGTIQQANPRFKALFGYDFDELFGKSLTYILSTDNADDLSHLLRDVAVNRKYRRIEILARRKDDSIFPADAAFAAFSHNRETGIVCSLRDISEHKQLEQELRSAFEKQKELTELKTHFISTVSHEYRTPLAIIQTSTSLLMSYGDRLSDEQKQNHLGKIQSQVKRLTDLLNDVLTVSRAETIGMEFNPEDVDMVALFQEMIEDIQQINPKHDIELRVLGEATPIIADSKLIRQIGSNLLSNAVKYSPERGTIRVRLGFTVDGVTLTVQDEGMGIPQDGLDQLFSLFYRAKNVGEIQGTGLGLAIVKQAVEAHGGTISVESDVGQGTIFTVALPLLRN